MDLKRPNTEQHGTGGGGRGYPTPGVVTVEFGATDLLHRRCAGNGKGSGRRPISSAADHKGGHTADSCGASVASVAGRANDKDRLWWQAQQASQEKNWHASHHTWGWIGTKPVHELRCWGMGSRGPTTPNTAVRGHEHRQAHYSNHGRMKEKGKRGSNFARALPLHPVVTCSEAPNHANWASP